MIRNQIFKYLIILNIIILYINFFFFILKTKSILFKKIDFKYNDYFLLENCNKSFYMISDKLNKKLSISKNLSNIKNHLHNIETKNYRKNKTIVLYFEDNLNHIFENMYYFSYLL